MTAPLFHLPGDELSVTRDPLAEATGDPRLVVTLQQHPVAIARHLSRDDVRDLVQVLDDWLFDSRPGPR
jgi:hypothetical protein